MSIWRVLEIDSKALEVATAVAFLAISGWTLTAAVGVSNAVPHGADAVLALVWLLLSVAHVGVAASRVWWTRQVFAVYSALLCAWLAVISFHTLGLSGIGAPAWAVASAGQAWAYLAIEAKRVNHRYWFVME